MKIPEIFADVARLPGALPIWHGVIDAAGWQATAAAVAQAGGRLVAVWGSGGDDPARPRGCAAYALTRGLVWLELPLAADDPEYPDLAPTFPAASRMQRAAHDLSGVRAAGAADNRAWLNHGGWPAGDVPLRHPGRASTLLEGAPVDDYAFVRVEGDGVHEIPVGPVHAGIIEPG